MKYEKPSATCWHAADLELCFDGKESLQFASCHCTSSGSRVSYDTI